MVVGSIPKLIMCKNICNEERRRRKESKRKKTREKFITNNKEEERREENKKTFHRNVHRYVDAAPTSQASTTYLSLTPKKTRSKRQTCRAGITMDR